MPTTHILSPGPSLLGPNSSLHHISQTDALFLINESVFHPSLAPLLHQPPAHPDPIPRVACILDQPAASLFLSRYPSASSSPLPYTHILTGATTFHALPQLAYLHLPIVLQSDLAWPEDWAPRTIFSDVTALLAAATHPAFAPVSAHIIVHGVDYDGTSSIATNTASAFPSDRSRSRWVVNAECMAHLVSCLLPYRPPHSSLHFAGRWSPIPAMRW